MKIFPGKLFVLFIALILLGSSCRYQKILKSSDNELKYTKAKAYYDKQDYAKAMTLFEQLTPIFRGTDRGEEVSFLFAYSNYYLKDYIMAGHYFRRFTSSFPNSTLAMESSYMSAYCYYLDAPKPSLDQETTIKAITEFEIYLSKYPLSDKVAQCNELIDELRFRLEKKSYENAMLYYRVEQYKAAVVALRGSLREFPDSEFREDILFYLIKSNYQYAMNSVYSKTRVRLQDAAKDYKTFIKAYPNSKHIKDVTKIYEDISRKIEILN
jgi:outer membrane protein assembly factor BamD